MSEPILPLSIFRRARRSPAANVAGLLLGGELLRVHLRRHSVHAAGPSLQRAADRGRVAGRFADVDRRSPACRSCWVTRVGAKPGDGGRDGADRRGDHLGHPGARSAAISCANLAGPMGVSGAGTAFSFIPISDRRARRGARKARAGLASGLLNTSEQLGGAIGIAIARASPRARPRRSRTQATPFRWLSPAASSTPCGCSGRSR